MAGFRKSLRRLFRRARQEEDGATTIEFLVWIPLFVTLIVSSLEAGLIALEHTMLERSVDLTVRDLRLDLLPNPTHDNVKAAMCDRILIVAGCGQRLLLQMKAIRTTTWLLPAGNTPCEDHSDAVDAVVDFNPGARNDLMIVRACLKVNPFFPTTDLGLMLPKDGAGMVALISTSAFVNEPSE